MRRAQLTNSCQLLKMEASPRSCWLVTTIFCPTGVENLQWKLLCSLCPNGSCDSGHRYCLHEIYSLLLNVRWHKDCLMIPLKEYATPISAVGRRQIVVPCTQSLSCHHLFRDAAGIEVQASKMCAHSSQCLEKPSESNWFRILFHIWMMCLAIQGLN
jgi:hypothetical protein